MTPLGTLGGSDSSGNGINNSGQITGESSTINNSTHAFVYSAGQMSDVGTLEEDDYSSGSSINDAGQVTGSGSNHAFLATPFWRQADAIANGAAIPSVYGYVKPSQNNAKSSMIVSGCALCSTASAARSVIALNAKVASIPILTPALLDSLLTAPGVHGYTSANDLVWSALPTALKPYVDLDPVQVLSVTTDNYDTLLSQQINTLGKRVVLKFTETKLDLTTGSTKTGKHFVWVIGKDGADWKLGDGGWTKNILPPQAIETLSGHLAGFQVTNGLGHQIQHNFQLDSLIVFSCHGYTPPVFSAPSQAGILAAKSAAVPSDSSGGSAASVSVIAGGPVDFVLTDPNGNRMGHDQNSSTDFAEITGASYFTTEPILTDDDDDLTGQTDGSTNTNVIVPSPVTGTYTVAVTGTDTGTSEVIFQITGPGGASRSLQTTISTVAGQTTSQQIAFPTPGTADLAITQTTSPSQANVGDNLTYTITVTNNGSDTATAPLFTDVLQDGVNLVSAVSTSGTCTLTSNVVGCVLNDIAPGATATITITVTSSVLGSITNLVNVIGFEGDPNETNNSASAQMGISGSVLEGWRQQFFGIATNSGNAADTFDYDNDGLPNLLEWACNQNPTVPNTLPASAVLNGQNIEFTYTRSVSALNAGASFIVEWSDTLSNDWQSTSVTQTILTDDGTVQQVNATLPIGNTGHRFVHLKVTAPP